MLGSLHFFFYATFFFTTVGKVYFCMLHNFFHPQKNSIYCNLQYAVISNNHKHNNFDTWWESHWFKKTLNQICYDCLKSLSNTQTKLHRSHDLHTIWRVHRCLNEVMPQLTLIAFNYQLPYHPKLVQAHSGAATANDFALYPQL